MDQPPIMDTFRYNLKRIREERLLTQRDLAEKLGVSQGCISRLEGHARKYRYGPTLAELDRIANALGVQIQELIAD